MAIAELPPDTIADLLDRLGGVPAHRVLLKPTPGTATEDDVTAALEQPRKRVCELIDGVLVEKAVGNRESYLGMYLGALVLTHVRAGDLGIVLGEAGHIRVRPGQLRAPDVTFIPWSALPDEELPDEAYWSVAPGLAAEVLSPDSTKAEIDRKLDELFAAGCKLAWVIDPDTKTAKVYTSAKRFKELNETGTLDGGKVLPGFKLPLADLFAATRRRKKKPR
jgi:Uma2 family endonuclease